MWARLILRKGGENRAATRGISAVRKPRGQRSGKPATAVKRACKISTVRERKRRDTPRAPKKNKDYPPKMAGLRAARSPRCSRAESPACAGVSDGRKKTELPHWAIPLFSFIQTKTIGGNWHSPLYFRQAEMSNSPRTTLQGTPFDLQIFSKFSPNFSECVASSFPFG